MDERDLISDMRVALARIPGVYFDRHSIDIPYLLVGCVRGRYMAIVVKKRVPSNNDMVRSVIERMRKAGAHVATTVLVKKAVQLVQYEILRADSEDQELKEMK